MYPSQIGYKQQKIKIMEVSHLGKALDQNWRGTNSREIAVVPNNGNDSTLVNNLKYFNYE